MPRPCLRISVDLVAEIVESSTAQMGRRLFMCLVLAGCGQDAASIAIDARSDSPAATDAAATCGVRTGQRGKTNRSVRVAGLDRTYIVYLPDAVDPRKPVPLVFVHHGYTMSAQAMFEITGYPALADTEHIALAFPDGQGGPNSLAAPWNVGADTCPASTGSSPPTAPGDDFALLDAIKADIALDQCIDDEHLFVTGFSMGGYFSHHTGCMRDDIRAVAPHSGGTHTLDSCVASPKPIIIFHGKSDSIVPADCDDPTVTPRIGVTPSATRWAQKNGCVSTTTTMSIQGGACMYYDGCPAGAQVAMCSFAGMRHCWAGGVGPNVYSCEDFEAATALEWAFFKQHAW